MSQCPLPVIIPFNYALFIQQFPAFANPSTFPEAMIQMYWDMSLGFISPNSQYGWLRCLARQMALNLMTAHLTWLSAVIIPRGQYPQVIQGSTIDKVSITLTPPPLKDQWDWWLNSSPYGMQLHALLQAKSVGGWYVGGSAPLSGFGYGGYPLGNCGGSWGW